MNLLNSETSQQETGKRFVQTLLCSIQEKQETPSSVRREMYIKSTLSSLKAEAEVRRQELLAAATQSSTALCA
jgi:polyhydroxyalkanoate synthesis regulator phasin